MNFGSGLPFAGVWYYNVYSTGPIGVIPRGAATDPG